MPEETLQEGAVQEGTLRTRFRTGLAVLGAAALLVTGVDLVGYAATGDTVILGKTNTAKKTTTIKNTKGTALKLKSKSSKPALAVNNSKLIKKLNADLVDGKSLDELEPATQTFTIGTAGAYGTGTEQNFQTTTLPAGTYEFDLGGIVYPTAGDTNACAVLDATRLIASGDTDSSSFYIYWLGGDDVNQVSGHFVGEVVAGHRIMIACDIDTGTVYAQPVQLTVKRLDRTGAIPGMAATTYPRGAAQLQAP